MFRLTIFFSKMASKTGLTRERERETERGEVDVHPVDNTPKLSPIKDSATGGKIQWKNKK